MTTYFVKSATITGGSAPSDTNDGKDPIGFGLSAATYNDATKTLTESGAFTSYVFTSGDQIAILAGTGANAGLYEIASKVDANNITLASSAGSTDVSGDWTSSDGPFLLGSKASDTIAAGDSIAICDDTHAWSGAWTWGASSTSGTLAAPVNVYGATSRGQDYRGTDSKAQISRTTTATLLYDNGSANTLAYVTFSNMIFADSNEGAAILANHNGLRFVDCWFKDNDDYGIQVGTSVSIIIFIRCEFSGTVGTSGGDGFGAATISEGQAFFFDCSFHDNARHGARVGGQMHAYNCVNYDNGGDGFHLEHGGSTRFFTMHNCVVHGNTGDGVLLVTAGIMLITAVNNIFALNGGYGFNLNGEDIAEMKIGPNNYYNNTAGEASLDGIAESAGTVIDIGTLVASIATDPDFASVVDGSENFTPSAQHATFSNGEAGDVPVGVTTPRQTYLGAVAPNLGEGGDGAGGGGGYMIGG
jgi:hypothetical protein